MASIENCLILDYSPLYAKFALHSYLVCLICVMKNYSYSEVCEEALNDINAYSDFYKRIDGI